MTKHVKTLLIIAVVIVVIFIFRIPGMLSYMFNEPLQVSIENMYVLVGLFILLVVIIKFIINRDINRAYRIKVAKVIENAGFTKTISDRVSRSDQSTINKFVKLADVISKQEEDQ